MDRTVLADDRQVTNQGLFAMFFKKHGLFFEMGFY
jgi:hypothetical protein